jgi:hypothetical protein
MYNKRRRSLMSRVGREGVSDVIQGLFPKVSKAGIAPKLEKGKAAIALASGKLCKIVADVVGKASTLGVRRLYGYVLHNPVVASLLMLLGLGSLVVLLSYSSYDRDFWRNVKVEAHGMVFNALVVGILVLWFTERGWRRNRVQRCKDEIDDLRAWEDEQATHRIRGNIVRLNREGITEIDLHRCYLRNVRLPDANLEGALLWAANLEGALLWAANLKEAQLGKANLKGARMVRANLKGADLRQANLKGADLRQANLEGADLEGANLEGAKLPTHLPSEKQFQDDF